MQMSAPSRRRPNIIFILTDDQGWQDLGSFGHPYLKTPHLDRLATEGASFTNFYVASPVCSPSRVCFMTGYYPARHNVHDVYRPDAALDRMRKEGVPPYLDPQTPTLTRILRENGYATGHFGKWHMGNVRGAPPPAAYGIDEARVVSAAPEHEGWPAWRDEPHWRARSTDLFVDETIRFIDQHRDQPFYVNLWTLIPHARLDPTSEQLSEYEDLKVDPADFAAWMRPYLEQAADLGNKMKVYCASITALDKAVGRLLDYLDDAGLTDDTLVFFTSDNGPEDYRVRAASNAGVGSPGIGRARKRSIYEGGVRVPAIARWPGHIPAGDVDAELVLGAVDFVPTICSIANVTAPITDGEDVSDILAGRPRSRRAPLFWEWKFNVSRSEEYRPPTLAVRDGRWKLFMNADGGSIELYDLEADPSEYANVAEQHASVVARLSELLGAWKATLPHGYAWKRRWWRSLRFAKD